ncbi:MAG TPA: helix-turn-helix transcriptional regulator [Pantanalinema sp.]
MVPPSRGDRLAERLSELRKAAGLTQVQLAERAGISRAYLAALERGLSSATKAPPNPSREILDALARALGLDRAALLGQPERQTALPFPEEAAASLSRLGFAPAPAPGGEAEAWALPVADGVVEVADGVDEALGLSPGDGVLVRTLAPGAEAPEGLCLIETGGAWTWGRLARIAGQPFASAPDGSYRPLGKGAVVRAEAIALVRRLHDHPNGA